jgi:hypothetical protein
MGRNSIFWGVLILLLGCLFLLNSLGVISINLGMIILPLFIIAVGIWILWGAASQKTQETQHATVQLEGANRARIRIRHGAGRLQLKPGVTGGDLVVGDFGGGLDKNVSRSGDLLEVTLSLPSRIFLPIWQPGNRLDWSIALVPDVSIELEFETGAGETNLDLSGLQVTRLRMNSGASSNRVTMPANAGFTQAEFRTGAASLDICIPDEVAARIRASGGLSTILIDRQRFPRSGKLHQSPDYDTAANKIEILVETGVGSINIR